MSSKIVRRQVRVRCSPIPPARGGFQTLLGKLAGASEKLEKARRR
jgi:hypothetical protein